MKKEHILSEIKRTANENGGVPLGKTRFNEITGIKDADWIGRHWAKWSDAVSEAGYKPNEMNAAYADESVISALASIVEEMGKWPTSNELKS